MIRPTGWNLGFLKNTIRTTPAKAIKTLDRVLSSAIRRPVTVVPILAPMMIQAAWVRVIIRELTNPTTITVVAEED